MVLEVVDIPSVTWDRTGTNPIAISRTADMRPGTAHVHEVRGFEDDMTIEHPAQDRSGRARLEHEHSQRERLYSARP